ncbi:MAG: glycosyltransferase [Muribaculaceae bacterium]|jgi:1,2-diacylglycerol 3-alpha-glucosyltransferase|nr:glycosyltransferase [Muribaculaceae bacterium]
MNILILNPILFSGDGEKLPKVNTIKDTMIYTMCLGFKALGHRVVLISAKEYKPNKEEQYDFEIVFFESQCKKIFSPMVLPYSWNVYKYIKQHRGEFDMILCSETFGFHSLFAALLAPRKTLIWQELNVHQKKFHKIPSHFWHSVVVPLCFRKVRIVVGRSETARIFISKYMKRVSSITVDHGINIDKFTIATYKKRQFISSAQLIYRKNVDGIIRKFGDFIKMSGNSDFRLMIAGRGPMEHELRELVETLGINENVEFLGFLSHLELSKAVSESMAFLINTRQDLNMVSIPESIASGTPVITNMVPALAGFINEHGLGIAKDDWDKEDMVKVANDTRFAENCVNIRGELSSTHVAKTLIDIFNQNEDY